MMLSPADVHRQPIEGVTSMLKSSSTPATGTTQVDLPRWDMTAVYPGLDAPELARDTAALRDEIAALGALFDRYGIGMGGDGDEDGELIPRLEDALDALNATLERTQTLGAYLSAFVATDSRDDLA